MPKEDKQDAQKTERFNMFMSPSEMQAIDEWAWKNRVRSKSEAVRRLVQIGLAFDENADSFAERFMPLYDMYSQRMTEAFEKLVGKGPDADDGGQFVKEMYRLSVEMIEGLTELGNIFNTALAPRNAMKADEPYEAAQYGFLAAKAASLSKLLQQKVDAFEFRKEHGLLFDERKDERKADDE